MRATWVGLVVALVIVASLPCVAIAAPTPRSPLAPERLVVPPRPHGETWSHRLIVKFVDAARVRQLGAHIVVEGTGSLTGVESLRAREGLRFSPLLPWSAARAQALQARAAARSGRAQPDLLGLFVVQTHAGADLVRIGHALEADPLVEGAWIETLGVAPPEDIAPPTPNLVDQQDYRLPEPGLDLRAAWNMELTGAGLRLGDVEIGWNAAHEEFLDISLNPEPNQTPNQANDPGLNHGTAVLGVTSAPANGYGITGGVPDASVHTHSEQTIESGFQRVAAILSAIDQSGPGDVVMLEIQTPGPLGEFVPGEWEAPVWMATRLGADAGVVLVAAAGNGNQDLDGPDYAEYRSRGDSGAIIVGAGNPNGHGKLAFSTYGSRVDLQGWGQQVFTLGYGLYAQYGDDENQSYTQNFAGTSAATPLVASAALSIQQLSIEALGEVLAPEALRQILIDTGVPQGPGGEIGPLPDVRAAAMALLSEEALPPVLQIVEPPDALYVDTDLLEIDVVIDGSDDSRLVDHVQLQINGELIDVVDQERPFVFSGVAFPVGTWEIAAVGRDLWGNIGQSESIVIYVGVDAPIEEPEPTGGTGTDSDDANSSTGTPPPEPEPGSTSGTSDDDTGGAPASGTDDGCGCRNQPLPPGARGLALLLPVLMLARRRRGTSPAQAPRGAGNGPRFHRV